MALLFRVLVAAFVCVAPTVLFLGLWHGLYWMQDDELTERIADQEDVTVDDLLPGMESRHELDSSERRRLQHMTMDDGSDDRNRP